jgi:release factor glutamine methyltransferase
MIASPHANSWCVQKALKWAGPPLAETIESALSARMLLAHVLACSTTDLFVHPERVLTPDEQQRYRHLVARRARHEPVAYLLGHRAFLDIDLIVNPHVLIPRPETEVIIEQAVEIARRWQQPKLVDVGTGSGAIAIGLARHLPQASIFATEQSKAALQVAQENARRHSAPNPITFMRGNLLAPLCARVHVIVANLPYVSCAEYAALPPDIRLYEPREALLAGTDGLDAIRALLETARPYLTDDGVILLEIGAAQGKGATEIASEAFPEAEISILSDYAHLDRVVQIDLSAARTRSRPV